MKFELTYHIRKDDKTISEPCREDVLEAYRVLREEDVYVADLRNVQTGALLQLVTLDAGESVCAAMFPFDDAKGALYSESDALTIAEALAICGAFMTSGDVCASGVMFNDQDWFERPRTGDAAPGPSSTTAALEKPDTEEDPDPQDVINWWLQDNGCCGEDLVQWALDAGATFAAFTSTPPLIYIAQHRGHDDAVEFLLSLGEDISATYDGGTALWHAISNGNYCLADELLLRGAEINEARSSKNFSRWKKRDEQSKIFEAVANGHVHAVDAYLKGRHPRRVSMGLLAEAVLSSQQKILKRLLSHKSKHSATTAQWESLWGRAMEKSDVGYLQALIDHGVYESVATIEEYGGGEFLSAAPEALSFLFSNGYTAGFEKAFTIIISRNSRGARALLATFPDAFFYQLSAEQLANAILSFQKFAPERIDTVLNQNEFAPLLRYIFHGDQSVTAYEIMPTVLGFPFSGPYERYAPTYEAREDMRALCIELREMARGLL